MQKIVAKFRCDTVIPATENYDAVAYLSAVIGGEITGECEENKSFCDSTPSGQITISISKDVPAHKFFTPGREYYLDFRKVPLKKGE